MTQRILPNALGVLALITAAQQAIAAPATPLLKALGRYISGSAAEEAGQKLTKEIGEEVVERVATRVVRETGEESLEQVSKLVAKHGPDVIRAIDNAPDARVIINALDELPIEDVPTAVARLAAGKQGQQLAKATREFGADALRAEVRHPGVGSRYVRVWGEEGVALTGKLTTDEAIHLGRHLDDLATAPAAQRGQLIAIIKQDKDRFFRWLGKFVENNPGKSIGSATFLALFLPNSDKILGDGEIVFDENGKPQLISKPGLLSAPTAKLGDATAVGLSKISRGVAIVIALALAAYAAIKLLGVWRRQSIKTHSKI